MTRPPYPSSPRPRRRRRSRAGTVLLLAAGATAAFAALRLARRRAPVRWARPAGELRPGPLALRLIGSAGPPVVLLPGIVGTGLYWGRGFDRLGHRARVAIASLPGFDASAAVPDGAGDVLVEAMVERLAATLSDAFGDEPVLLAGHSIGVLLALAYARRHPDRTHGVLGFAPPVHASPPAAARGLARLGFAARLLASDGGPTVPGSVAAAAAPVAAWALQLDRPELPGAVARRGVPREPRRWAAAVAALAGVPSMRWVAESPVPLRFVAGGRDASLDHGLLERLARESDELELETWPALGHDLPLAAPGRCAAEILELLRRAEPIGA